MGLYKLSGFPFASQRGNIALLTLAGLLSFPAQGLCVRSLDNDAAPPSSEALRNMSIEDLAQIEVTSVSKRPEALNEAPATVYVITSTAIRRSGLVSLPEVLRLAPNLEVAKINAYSWTVTARGFNSPETANKLLVLVDGRSVYEPIGAGVLWQQVDVALDNIDRIEVISGPGGTLWGANAVNGVINIITKNAAATQGLYMRATSGLYKRNVTARFGGRLGDNAHFRLFADGFRTNKTMAAIDTDTTTDAFKGWHGGFGIDGKHGLDITYRLRGDAYENEIAASGGQFNGYNLVGGLTRTFTSGSVMTLQAYIDHNVRKEPTLYESRDTFNIEIQHSLKLGTRHQFVWGGEFRHWWGNFNSYNNAQFATPKTTISLGSIFAQDEIALRNDLKLTLGLKAEYNSYSGLDGLPSARIAWQRDRSNLIWGAVSRAVRTPNRVERELHATGLLLPSPDFQSEKLTAYELGWRAQPTANSSLSLSAFYHAYDDLRTWGYPPTIFPLVLQNGARGNTYGLEGWGKIEVVPGWRLSAGFNTLRKDFELKPGHNDLSGLAVTGQDPNYQAQLRSEWNITDDVEFDVAMRRVGKVVGTPVPAYTEAGFRVGWRVTNKVELALNASNLLHKRHIEVWDPSTASPRYVGRSIMASIRYGY